MCLTNVCVKTGAGEIFQCSRTPRFITTRLQPSAPIPHCGQTLEYEATARPPNGGKQTLSDTAQHLIRMKISYQFFHSYRHFVMVQTEAVLNTYFWFVLIGSNKVQQYAGIYLLQVYSTCFGRPSRPSSGVQKTVTAAPGTGHSNSATTFLQRGLQPTLEEGRCTVTMTCTRG